MVCTFPLKLSQTLYMLPSMGICSWAPQRPWRCPHIGAVTRLHPGDVLSFLCHRMCFPFPLISVCSHFSFFSVLYSASRSLFFHPDLPIFLVLNFPVSGNVSISHRLFLLFPCPQAGPVQLASAFSSPEKTKTKTKKTQVQELMLGVAVTVSVAEFTVFLSLIFSYIL